MFMRFLGGGIGHRVWHLLPQPDPLPRRRTGPNSKDKGRAVYDDEDEDDIADENYEEDDENYEDTLEDLLNYIEELEDNPEAITSTTDDEEGPGVEEEREEWGYGDQDSAQVIDEERGPEDKNEDEDGDDDDLGPEGVAPPVDDEAFDLGGFAEF